DKGLWRASAQRARYLHLRQRRRHQRVAMAGVEPGHEIAAIRLLPDEFHDGGRVEVNHQRSSSRIAAISEATSTLGSARRGGSGTGPMLIGATARPDPTSLASAEVSSSTGTSRAMGRPRSVISIVSPPATRART